ncbi:MAG: TolC family protein [Pseudomonadales bacterium]|nr:TolC family protein [Pseudomonadales bacterium]
MNIILRAEKHSKNRVAIGFVAAMLGLTSLAVSSAEEEQAQTNTLTLQEAILSTVTQNPELLAFGYALRAQDGRILQAGLSPRPQLNINVEDVLGDGAAQGLSGAEVTVSIAWVVEGELKQRRIDVARAGSLALAAEAEIMRLDAAAVTARHYIQALAHQLRRDFADQAVALAEETVVGVERRVEAGTASSAELSRARAELARRALSREDINHELNATFHRLAAQWGALTPAFSRVVGNPLVLPEIESFDTLRAKIEQTPDLNRFLSEQRVAEAVLRLEQARSKEPWRFSAGVRRLQGSSDSGFTAGVTIPLDRGNRNQGRIAESRARIEQSVAEETAARIRIQTNLLVLYLEMEHSIHRVQTLSEQVVPRVEQALEETRRAYELGSYSYLEWLQVQEELLEARNELVQASVEAHQRMIEIERITGMRIAQQTPSL